VRVVTPIWILHVDLDQFLASVEMHRHHRGLPAAPP
jgi:nucleotidyltransferase/DNA polymerase involved in DNA repair